MLVRRLVAFFLFEWLCKLDCKLSCVSSGSSVSGSMEKLPPDLDTLERAELVVLSLRINSCWPTNKYWTRERLLKRLRSWESEQQIPPWMLSLSMEDLVAMALKVNPQRSSRRCTKEEYISELNEAMTRVFTDVCHLLQYGFVHCVSSLYEKARKRDRTRWGDVAGGVQHERFCVASEDTKI